MSDYPEHDKLTEVKETSHAIGEFLDFSDYTLCRVVQEGDNGQPKFLDEDGNPANVGGMSRDWNPAYESWRTHYQPVAESIQEILADYFEIDLDVLEREKRAMLDAIRRPAPPEVSP